MAPPRAIFFALSRYNKGREYKEACTMTRQITVQHIQSYQAHLRRAERSPGTIENYLRHATAFARWLGTGR